MEDMLLVKEKEIVTPGETIATGMGFLPGKGTFREGNDISAIRYGIIETEGKVLKIIPLTGKYQPRSGDKVIGKVIDVLLTGWRIDFGTAYSGVLNVKDATSRFINRGEDITGLAKLGELLLVQIINITSQKLVDLSLKGPGLRKLNNGRIIEVNAQKVPRIIGKEGSMLSLLRTATKCEIEVGQNGTVWLSGEPENEILAVQAIKKIEEEAHLQGLTDKIKTFLNFSGEIPHYQEQEYSEENENERGYNSRGPSRYGGNQGGHYGDRRPPRYDRR